MDADPFIGSRVAVSAFFGFAGACCGAFPGGERRPAPGLLPSASDLPPHDASSHRRSLGPPGRVCCAAATSAGDGPGRWRAGPSAAAPAKVRGGGVGGRRPGFGDMDVAEKPPWTGSRRPGRGPPTPPPPRQPPQRPRARHATGTETLTRSAGTTPRTGKPPRTRHGSPATPRDVQRSSRQLIDAADSLPDSMLMSKPRVSRYLSVTTCPVPTSATP